MDLEGRPLTLLVNPSAGRGRAREILPTIEAELDKRRVPFRVEKTKNEQHAIDEAIRAAEAGEIPVVVSGDGLIGAIGGALSEGQVPMGIIPGGRGNDLARVLGISPDPIEAIASLLDGQVRSIDVGDANGHRFLCIASFGFDSDANRIANQTRFIRGRLVYAYAALRALAFWHPARFRLSSGGKQTKITGYTVAVANSKAYGGGMFVAPDAELDDGLFDVIVIGAVGKFQFLRNFPKVFKGTHVDDDEVRTFRTPSIQVDADRPFAVYADGEHITDLPATIRVIPSALRVIVPRDPT